MTRRYAPLLVILAACTGEGGDDTDSGDSDVPTSDLPGIPAPPLLRGVHLAPAMAPGCDLDGDTGTVADQVAACVVLFVGDGQVPLAADAFPFGANSTFLPLPITGTYDFHAVGYDTFLATPALANTEEARVASFSVTVLPESVQTFVAFGHPGYANTGVAVIDDEAALAPPASGQARLRVFHGAFAASTAAPDVLLGATPIADGLGYGSFSAGVELAPGDDQVVAVDLTGDGAPDLIALADLAADTAYDLFLVNVSTSVVPSGFLGFLHTATSQSPVLVPFGPPPT